MTPTPSWTPHCPTAPRMRVRVDRSVLGGPGSQEWTKGLESTLDWHTAAPPRRLHTAAGSTAPRRLGCGAEQYRDNCVWLVLPSHVWAPSDTVTSTKSVGAGLRCPNTSLQGLRLGACPLIGSASPVALVFDHNLWWPTLLCLTAPLVANPPAFDHTSGGQPPCD